LGGGGAVAPLPIAALDRAQRLSCLRLIRSDGIGPVSFRELINRFGGATPAIDAVPELLRKAGARRQVRICPVDVAEAELEAAAAAGLTPLFTIEPGYPAALARIDAPPPLVYVKGNIGLLNRHAVAIVGSRDASANGHALARRMAADFGGQGLVVVSGLARGIDQAAHKAALGTGTVAVVAGGLDVVYPPEHAALQAAIAEAGCLIGEMPPGFQPRGQDFPRRNRLIAGLSLAVVVVEAARRSGTLITARFAGEFGREVCAVPGHPLDPRAEGTNQLLKDGATLVTSADDVIAQIAPQIALDPNLLSRGLGETGPLSPNLMVDEGPPQVSPPRPEEEPRWRHEVMAVLGPSPASVDDIARASGLATREVKIALLDLSLGGLIETHGGDLVSLRPGAALDPRAGA
jgi:DNA processing protein